MESFSALPAQPFFSPQASPSVMAGRSFDPKALRRGQVADDAGDGEDASSSNHHPDKFWDDSHILAGNTRREAGKRNSA